MTRERPIRFGTSGWRGVIGDEITLPRAAAVVSAVAQLLPERGLPRAVLVAHDTRPGGDRLAREAAAQLAARGLRVGRVADAIATPIAAHAVARGGYGAGLMFTASHNPPAYHGLKVIGPGGSVLGRGATRRLESLAGAALGAGPPPAPRRRGPIHELDPRPDYLAALASLLDTDAIAGAGLTIHFDAMHGAGAGMLDVFLERSGARVKRLRADRDARFGGQGPDPVAGRLSGLARSVRTGRGLRFGLATDGDADRYAAVDSDGRILSATQVVALLVDHLAEAGRIARGVAISVATGSLVERVARARGLSVSRHPIGFKWLSGALLDGEADCAGEESGGFVWRAHGVDKDGILSGALLAESVGRTGQTLGAQLEALERRHGASHCGRIAVRACDASRTRLTRLLEASPTRVAGRPVTDVDRRDGLRLGLDDGFLMLRGSGTEPVLRIYAEAGSATALRARLSTGARWLGAGSSGNLAN
jgi:phosphomannomutase